MTAGRLLFWIQVGWLPLNIFVARSGIVYLEVILVATLLINALLVHKLANKLED